MCAIYVRKYVLGKNVILLKMYKKKNKRFFSQYILKIFNLNYFRIRHIFFFNFRLIAILLPDRIPYTIQLNIIYRLVAFF